MMRLCLLLLSLSAAGLTVALGLRAYEQLQAMEGEPASPFDAQWIRLSAQEMAGLPLAVRWDMPMGSEAGALTYNAQPFRITRHLGDDLNGIGGYNSDLGDAVYAAALGKVVYHGVPSPGWGKVIILAHRVKDAAGRVAVVQSMYAHLLSTAVAYGDLVQRGQVLGQVGTADGKYLAHLHFEIRRGPYVNPSLGYADAPLNRESPEAFIARHRGAPPWQLGPAPKVKHP
jgi:hypothetical protein